MAAPRYQLPDILRGTAAEYLGPGPDAAPVIAHIAWDTRLITHPAETLFVALPGQGRDGHQYVQAAVNAGVKTFLLSRREFAPAGAHCLLVDDTLAALQSWGTWHRAQFRGHLVAITGSNGKTTVKEWLGSVLENHSALYKSPRSFNSQLGVALSLIGLDLEAPVALLEAGISRSGEMQKLRDMLRPTTGILTHMGDAHADGFESPADKIKEKTKLFQGCQTLLCGLGTATQLRVPGLPPVKTIGIGAAATLKVQDVQQSPSGGWTFSVGDGNEEHPFHLPVSGEAALENAHLVILAARHLGMDWSAIRAGIEQLSPVTMRTEMITDNPEITVINDAYNADADSVHNAFTLLEHSQAHLRKIVVLSDLEHQGNQQRQVQQRLLQVALEKFGEGNVIVVGPVFHEMNAGVQSFPHTPALLENFDYSAWKNSTVLLKGARRFGLEQLIPWLTQRANATYFKVNMNALTANYRQFRRLVPQGTRMMAMVKAFSYGSGSWEIAEALAHEGIDYLAVAAPTEGIVLRTRGIRTPVMVMNWDASATAQLFRFSLEPEVYSMNMLQALGKAAGSAGVNELKIHLKVDTGMGRLGFSPTEVNEIATWLRQQGCLRVVSVLSHLASADMPQLDEYTHQQATVFIHFCNALDAALGYRPFRHLLNTAGVMRFPKYAFDMVRVGIGLYGVNPLGSDGLHLEEIGSVHSAVQQIHAYPKGAFVGYGCSAQTQRDSRIATVPVGYADGIRRALGNGKMSFLVRGQRAPVFGRVCMDMLMLDVTDIPGVEEGDEVVIFGRQGDAYLSVNELAAKCDTIPYEILSGISQRVRRIYVKE